VPLASGLLSGKYILDTVFADDDHRTYNRHGEAFDVGETFSGVDYPTGVQAAAEFTAIAAESSAYDGHAPAGTTTAQAALRWVIQQPGVTIVIPGARNTDQARQNAAAAALPPLSGEALARIESLYDKYFREQVHNLW
jgi:aryl-alcohol dehydrogenase-like predicted oxidoreductase